MVLLILGWEWDEENENEMENLSDKGCETGEQDLFYNSDYAKDTPKQLPKALRNHLPPGGRLAPTPDDFQVKPVKPQN